MKYLSLTLIFIAFVGAGSCRKIPPYEGSFSLGDSATNSLIGEFDDIACDSAEFDNQVCQSFDDFVDEFMLRFECKEWKPGVKLIDPQEMLDNLPDIPGLKEAVQRELERQNAL